MSNDKLSAVDVLAIAKAVASKEVKAVRDKVIPGKYTGSVTVKIAYGLNVGEDYDSMVAASVPWQKICGVLLSKLNAVTIESVIREVLQNGADTAELDREARDAVQRLMEPAKKRCKGRVTCTATVEPVAL